MIHGIFPQYNGRYHEVKPLMPNNVKQCIRKLEDNERFVSVLWAGGWDEYIVDTNQIRPMTDSELKVEYAAEIGGIVRGQFLKGRNICQENECVKVVARLASGD